MCAECAVQGNARQSLRQKMWFLADSCDMKQRQCSSQSAERWLHHLVNERGLVMAVTRGEVCVFLCQLLGFQPDTGQSGRDHDLILKRSFSPERNKNTFR